MRVRLRSWLRNPRARGVLLGCTAGVLALFVVLLMWGVRRVPEGWLGVWSPDGRLAESGSVYLIWNTSSLNLYPTRVELDRATLAVGSGGDALRGVASLRGELVPEVARALASRSKDERTPTEETEQAVLQAIGEKLKVRDALELVESSPFPLETTWLRVAGVERGLRVESSEIDLVSVTSLRVVAWRLMQSKGLDAADAFLVSVMTRRRGDPIPICVRADLARLGGDTNRSELLYLEALELDPLMPEPMAMLVAQAQQRPDGLERSERLLRRALEIEPRSVQHLNWLSLVLARRGDIKGAEAALVRALAISPDSPTTSGNLAALLDRQGRRREAIERLQQALGKNPDEPVLLYNLGSALAGAGELQEALQALQRAERVSPPSEHLYSRLAAVYEMLGNTAQAEEYRKRAEEVHRARMNPLAPEDDS
jgi:tetratricopeptide (TPR) repeat protein